MKVHCSEPLTNNGVKIFRHAIIIYLMCYRRIEILMQTCVAIYASKPGVQATTGLGFFLCSSHLCDSEDCDSLL